MAINACFALYYSSLYSSKADYSGEELDSFLGQLTFPTLSEEAQNHLDSTIILEEVQQALGELQAGNTPDVDGLPLPNYSRSSTMGPQWSHHAGGHNVP